ncbi:hypothetical protein EBV26_19940, partial [bacterium]|nr:hypothetical protein [bacterium]
HKHHHSTITKALDHLLKKGNVSLQALHAIHNQHDEVIIDSAWNALKEELLSTMNIVFKAVELLPGFADGDFVGPQLFESWKTLHLLHKKILSESLSDDVFAFLHSFDAICKSIVSMYVTQKKVPTANYGKYSDISIDTWITTYYSVIDDLRKKCQAICIVSEIGNTLGGTSLSAEKEALRFARLLLDIALYASNLFETQKRIEGTLEFNDVQSIAMELLEHPEAGPKIRARIRFLMIDEFQDTNALQYELASRIVRSLKGEKTESDVNLYIVGDPKQSIYGFRSADVRVFGTASKEIQKANILNGTVHQSEHMNEDEQLGKLSLSTSFRLLPGIIGFINNVFHSLMGTESNGYEVGYEQMIGGRNVSDELLQSAEHGSITFLIHTQTEDDESQAMIDEASLIASAIKDLVVQKSKKVWDVEKDAEGNLKPILRDITYSDCTILYERRTMVNLLILSALLQKAQTMSLPILIHTLLEASHWRNIVKTMEDGAQWLANADKLISIAREFEQRGFQHLHAFVQELNLAAEYDDESEAPIVNTDNAVNLMTIHASKGLEFPIVLLYDTNTKERSTAPALYESDQFGIGLPLIKEYRVSGAHEIEQSLISMAVSSERKARSIAEKKRLLYVALTRAKDHVYISTSHKEGKEYAERSMMQLISTHSDAYAIAVASNGNTIYHTHIPILDSDQETISQIELDIPVSV